MKSAQESLDLELIRYKIGVDPYIGFVTAQSTVLGNGSCRANDRSSSARGGARRRLGRFATADPCSGLAKGEQCGLQDATLTLDSGRQSISPGSTTKHDKPLASASTANASFCSSSIFLVLEMLVTQGSQVPVLIFALSISAVCVGVWRAKPETLAREGLI